MKLTMTREDALYQFVSSDDCIPFLNRSASTGLVPGEMMRIVRNQRGTPILIFVEDTLIAVKREDAKRIEVSPFV